MTGGGEGAREATMADRRNECRAGGADHVWYFDEDGSLAAAGRAPRLQEWLGMGYALVGLALGSLAWLAPPGRPTREAHRGRAAARHVA
jgi:hypothetical protein